MRLFGPLLLLSLVQGCAWINEDDVGNRLDVDDDQVERPLDCDDHDKTIGAPTDWYADADGDGYGDPADRINTCVAPQNYVTNTDDCNDGDKTIHPNADEYCDGLDNDCSGTVDDEITLVTFYADNDGDSWGNEANTIVACAPPTGYVAQAGDCDDTTELAAPSLTEIACDGFDNDCLGDGDEHLPFYFDDDGDGYGDSSLPFLMACPTDTTLALNYTFEGSDCDDQDEWVHPAATEVCNGIDDDCDNIIDPVTSDDALIWYADDDLDGYGNFLDVQMSCTHPLTYVSNLADCDDTNIDVHPNAPELCDAIDNDCDSLTDDDDNDTQGANIWYFDNDDDGYGLTDITVTTCIAPPHYVEQFNDCDDNDNTIKPTAEEICDGVDNDCDSRTDAADLDLDPTELRVFYLDLDGDGFGAEFQILLSCDPPAQYVEIGGDCNDQSNTTFPGANEICDGFDNDCDFIADEGAFPTWYIDLDGDGFGLTSTAIEQCDQPPSGVSFDGDCDDTEPANYPGNTEVCDNIDNNCDSLVDSFDPLLEADAWYPDNDSDGHGDAASDPVLSCDRPSSHVASNDDCNDTISAIYWGADEICDGLDNDCDELTDDDDESLIADDWFYDSDGDGFGAGATEIACAAPGADFAAEPGDCDDRDANFFPGALEICDGLDNDCDGDVDDDDDNLDPLSTQQAYADVDEDLHGNPGAPFAFPTCLPPDGYVFDNRDCADDDATIHEDAPELCDAIDHNCNLNASDAPSTWSQDSDEDGYGNALATVVACEQPPGYVYDDTDCNDAVATVHPDAAEVCDSLDNDCDGDVDDDDTDDVEGLAWWFDSDLDGYGDNSTEVSRCDQPLGFVLLGDDCDDINPNINPFATEFCDFVDNDCDLLVDDLDDSVVDASTWYPDLDDDSFGDTLGAVLTCVQPQFYVDQLDDCNDDDFKIYPGATEVCDLQDNDCDGDIDNDDSSLVGSVSWFTDADQDGYGDPSSLPLSACYQPDDEASNVGDCDDTDSQIHPGAPLRCNGEDNDCDTVIDVGALDLTWYADFDSDGFGDPNVFVADCDPPDGYVTNFSDCNDSIALIAPGQVEICDDGVDNDCDTLVDLDDGFTVGGSPMYRDLDGDGFGDPNDSILSCDEPGFVTDGTDCDDNNATIYPGAGIIESLIADGIDQDCDGYDECYADVDSDGYAGAVVIGDIDANLCTGANEGTVIEDCQDQNINAYPGAPISSADVGDQLDQDCNGFEECFQDLDSDGSGTNTVIDDDGDLFCDGPGESYDNLDCDDGNDLRFPLSPEWCGDGLDNDCDALELIDEADPNGVPVPWYVDVDGDGYGDSAFSVTTCVQPPAFVDNPDDPDDRSPYADQIYPGAPELCDLLDNDGDFQVDAADPDFVGVCESAVMRTDDFTCSNEDAVGADSRLTGWQAIGNDLWASDLHDGVSATEDNATGTQGSPIDGAENFLLTGHTSWNNIAIEAVVHVSAPETGAIGLVGRYANADSYYQCVLTKDVTPGCTAPVPGARVALIRVDGSCSANDDYTVAAAAYAYPQDTDVLMELQAIDGDIRCTVDSDLDGVLGSGGDIVLNYVDGAPLPSGQTGLATFGLGALGRFDDVRISGFDGDQDGDGLSNLSEFTLGLDANNPDIDGDAISDRDETLDPNNPPNTDGDGDLDHSDADSDADGIADRAEAGDLSLLTPPYDSDCDGLPDYRDNDSDNDGVFDSADNCRTVPNGTQADGDSDGLGDLCDATPTNPDIDGDGLLDGVELAGGTDPNNPDTDGDGLSDGEEANDGTDRLFSDTDHDGLSDYDEVILHGTNPLSPDSDGDGAKDGEEVDAGTDPNVP